MTTRQGKIISASDAPAAVGPYSQGVIAGELLFISGQLPLDPETGQLVGQDIEHATARVLENIAAICRAAGASLADVVKTTVFLTDMSQFARFNQAYGERFGPNAPARTTAQAAALPKGAELLIEAVAWLGPARG